MKSRQITALSFAYAMSVLCVPTSAFSQEALPYHEVSLGCRSDVDQYIGQLRSFFDFVESQRGGPVYLAVTIEAADNAGSCPLDDSVSEAEDLPDDHGIRVPCMEAPEGTKVVWARTSEQTSGTTSLSLPPLDKLPSDGLYRLAERPGIFYAYTGPAVVHMFVSNGNDHVWFELIRDSHAYWREIQATLDPVRKGVQESPNL